MNRRIPHVELPPAQSVTVSKSGSVVTLQCDSCEDSETLFDWLEAVCGGEDNDRAFTFGKAHSIEEAVAYMTRYMTTYPDQLHYKDYAIVTYLHDMLYGVGVSLNTKFENADGYDEFKEELRKFLDEKK